MSDDAVAAVVDTASESYQLLHVTLTGFGDTSREVRVLSNDAVLAATVGINLAVAAARDSRSTLLIDATPNHSMVARMFGSSKKNARPTADAGASLRSKLVRNRVGRDLFLDTIALPAAPLATDELLQLAHDHDFTVFVQPDAPIAPAQETLPAADVILCVRVGVTGLDWITRKTAELREQNQRLRAVLLWSTRAPSIA